MRKELPHCALGVAPALYLAGDVITAPFLISGGGRPIFRSRQQAILRRASSEPATWVALHVVVPESRHVLPFSPCPAVGDDRTDFVSRAKLLAELGPIHAQQVHVWPATPAETASLKDFKIARRAAWNYARAIRSYQGKSGLLLMEDDI